jgi:acetyl esterase/lipase
LSSQFFSEWRALRQCARKLKEAGVKVDAVRYNGTIHDFVLLNALRDIPSTQAAIEQGDSKDSGNISRPGR